MFTKKETALARAKATDPLVMLRQVTAEIDRMFDQDSRWGAFATRKVAKNTTWSPEIDVFEKDNRLVTKIDLPGMKKEDIKVEVVDGQLTIAGERKTEAEEKKDNFYRCEREHGSFYRAVPLPDGVSLADVKATFADGVLEVSLPLPAPAAAPEAKTIAIEEPAKAAKTAA
jgi:HSP20 family protein